MTSRRAMRRRQQQQPKFRIRRLPAGLPIRTGHTLRPARPSELGRCVELAAQADGAPVEEPMQEAIAAGTAGKVLLEGLTRGRDVMTLAAAEAMHAGPERMDAFMPELAMMTVAENAAGGIDAVIYTQPPINTFVDLTTQGHITPPEAVAGMLAVAKIKALAVDPDRRNARLGATLLSLAAKLYNELGYLYLFGQFTAGSGLDRYYAARGFDIIPASGGLDLWVIFGKPVMVGAMPHEQMFSLKIREQPILGALA